MEVTGQSALVTGGAKRIGRAIATALAREGADVVVHYRSSEPEAEETARICRKLGVRAETSRADLSRHEQISALCDAAHSLLGATPTIIVNNASSYRRETFAEVTHGSFDDAVAVNLRAPLLLAQRMARDLPLSSLGPNGCVINLNDARQEYRTRWSYGITTTALSALTLALSNATPENVRVNELRLGPVLPPKDAEGADESITTGRVQLIPMASVVRAILDLIRDDAANGRSVELTA